MTLNRKDLHDYQNKAVSFISKNPKCGLFLDMGLGKTTTTLTAVSDMLDNFFINKVLIIAPLRVANTVWKQEAKKWSHLNHLKITICTGPEKQRLESLKSNSDIYVINRENTPWLVKNCKWEWDTIIIDESSSFKNHKSQRFKSLKQVLKNIKSIILLTGTPSPNGLIDLWSQIYLIDNGERLGRNISIHRKRYYQQHPFNQYKYDLIDGAEAKIREAIKDICLTMKSEDYLYLPNRIDINEHVILSDNVTKKYKELEKEFIITLSKETIEIPTAAAMANKLLQFCNGAIYDHESNYHTIHDEKIQRLKEIIEDNPNENFLIAYNYKSDLDRLLKSFSQGVVLDKKGEALEEWNKGNIKILFAHPASAGHGLNAQKGGSCVIWFGLNWSLELYQQFNARLYRQGQEKPVRIIHIIVRDSIDEKVLLALSSKSTNQENLLQFLKNQITL